MGKQIELQLRIPQSLNDITLQDYQKYVKVANGIEEETKESVEFLNLKALEIFCGLQLKESYKIPIHVFDDVLEQLGNVLSQDTPLVKRFWMRGSNGVEVEFGMHPNLNDMTSGEYYDLDNYINDFSNMHKAMAILFRPIVKHHKDLYDIEEYNGTDKYAEHMKYMPADVAIGARLFFYRLGMKLSKHTILSSLKEMSPQALSQVEKKFSERNGVGINQFMHSLEEMSQNLTKLPSLTSIPV
jgi:hypothetical protein